MGEARDWQNNMQALAQGLDDVLDGLGFALLVFDRNRIERGHMNWVSNGRREDMVVALKEMVAQLEGRAGGSGSA